ncbi:MAG: T9SS type A sorting domain-containing protein, partial [Saprospiraceae bacterium]
ARLIGRIADGKLDPRPSPNGSAYNTPLAAQPANDPFFTPCNFKGAFAADREQMWLAGWSTLARNGHLNLDVVSDVEESLEREIADYFKIFPNPASEGSYFMVESQFSEKVRIDIFSVEGRLMRSIPANNIDMTRVNIETLEKGLYVIKFTTESGKFAVKKLIVE